MSLPHLSPDETDALPGGGVGDLRGAWDWLGAVNQRFVCQAGPAMAAFMRRAVNLRAGRIEVHPHDPSLREVGSPASFSPVSIRPLSGMAMSMGMGTGLVVCDAGLVFASVEALFGGTGKYPASAGDRDFSATEHRVIDRLVEVLVADYSRVWQAVCPAEMACLRSERRPPAVGIAAPGDSVASTVFTVEIGESIGTFRIFLPCALLALLPLPLVAELARVTVTAEQLSAMRVGDFMALERDDLVRARVVGGPVIEANCGTSNGHHALRVARVLNGLAVDPVHDATGLLAVELGRAHLAHQDLSRLAPGSVVELDTVPGQPMAMRLDGDLIAHGEAVLTAQAQFGVRLTDLVSPAERVRHLTCPH